jgi:hypothetical protein
MNQVPTKARRVRIVVDVDESDAATIRALQERAPLVPSRASVVRAAIARGLVSLAGEHVPSPRVYA